MVSLENIRHKIKTNSKLLLLLFAVNILFTTNLIAVPQDSIGVEKKDGKVFVLHQVDAKETLYSIAKRYLTKVEDIKAANLEMGDGIKIGQTLRIPYKGIVQNLPGTTQSSNEAKNFKTHVVEKKETLYSISKKYNVNVEEITKANPGIETGLKEGQTLKIPVSGNTAQEVPATPVAKGSKIHKVEPKETLFGISKKYNVSVDDIKKANPELIDGLKEGMEIIIPPKGKNNSATSTVNPTKVVPVTMVKEREKEKEKEEEKPEVVIPAQNQPKGEFKKITETGIAELLESKTDAPKFQALHKTAPVGTIIQVVNESNGSKIFVRVIGKLTDVTDNKIIIKISQKAMDRLEVKDKKVAVSLTYIP
jgi:LysM repeat protein